MNKLDGYKQGDEIEVVIKCRFEDTNERGHLWVVDSDGAEHYFFGSVLDDLQIRRVD